jgi:predicted acylesterase/phospholipase RssA
MPKRLAITISGAVSLGSYEAGVLYEVITAIGQHNSHADTANEERIVIDVLTGASAGGMTAAIATQKLLYDADAFRGPTDNPFYNPWVRDVDLTGLLALGRTEDPRKSILSSDLVERIARRYLLERFDGGGPPSRRRHPAAADQIKLLLAMSNLDGIDYSVPQVGGTSFVYTRYQDEFRRDFTAGKVVDDTEANWSVVRDAAVACGAFPLAFRVKEVQRERREYRPNNIAFSVPSLSFAYTDGGVFQNEPLGSAKGLVNEIDHHRNTESRFYLYIAPGAKESVMNLLNPLRAANALLWPTLLGLVKALFHQARFQEWVFAEEVNVRVQMFNQRATGLKDALRNGDVRADDLAPAAQALISLLNREPANEANLATARQRLREQFAQEYDDLASMSQQTADVWIDSIVVLETAAELGPKDEMTIYTITARSDELAGELFYSFGGFFEQRLREYDYQLGRYCARRFLQGPALNSPGQIGPIRYAPTDSLPGPNPQIGQITMGQLDHQRREELRDHIMNRLSLLLEEAGVNAFLRWPVLQFLVRPRVNKALEL